MGLKARFASALAFLFILGAKVDGTPPKMMVVSFDGLSDKMLIANLPKMPNLQKVIRDGVRIDGGVVPEFPSSGCANTFSAMTGLYPEYHGITGCKMIDYKRQILHNVRNFSVGSESDIDKTWWDNGVNKPLWILNEMRRTYQRYSGGIMWSGTGSSYFGRKIAHYMPTVRVKPSNKTRFRIRIDEAFNWFQDETRPANSVFIYIEEPKKALFRTIDSKTNLTKVLGQIDDMIGYICMKSAEFKLTEELNLVLMSSYGINENQKLIPTNVQQFLGKDLSIVTIKSETIWEVHASPADIDDLYQSLQNNSWAGNFTVFRREDLPTELRFKRGPMVFPIIIIPNNGYALVGSKLDRVLSSGTWYNGTWVPVNGFFVASGPHFKKNFTISNSIRAVDIYPLLTEVLQLGSGVNNGSFFMVSNLLRTLKQAKKENNNDYVAWWFSVISIIGTIFLVVVTIFLFLFVYFSQNNSKQDYQYNRLSSQGLLNRSN